MCPDAARRWCTSDHQRARSEKSLPAWSPTCVQAATTAVHLLNVMGFRAEENPARRRRVPYAANPAASNGRRRVDDWYPIHDWTLAQVWERIAAGTRSHAAYAAGMSRLSCRFCVLSSRPTWCAQRASTPTWPTATPRSSAASVTGSADLTMADVIAEAHDAGQLALIPLADIA